ncbi:ABC transporter ATP-binding protein [Spirochaetia bacterium]|nr:ABC transporter ATP-binding protein [Spirochaetia bacterium]
MPDAIIKLENVSYAYPRSRNWALKKLDLEIGEGEFLAVMGENGAGKTTFCRLLNGIVPHSQGGEFRGAVTVDGELTIGTLASLTRKVGMVLDDGETQLFSDTVRGEAAFGPENLLLPGDEIEERVRFALEATGLAQYANAAPGTLSGGQKQRLAIAAALALGGKILVLDEPTSQLDPAGAGEVLSLIRDLRERQRVTVIMATHNSEEAAAFADRICVLKDGAIAACAAPGSIFCDSALLENCGIRPLGPDILRPSGEGILSAGNTMPVIQIDNLSFSYDSGNNINNVNIIDNLSLDIADNEITAIIGQNGGGKTTLLKTITGLLRPTGGDIFIRGKNTREMTVSAISAEIGFVMQNPDRQLFADTVYNETAYALKNTAIPEDEIRVRVEAALAAVGLTEKSNVFPPALSRGDRAKTVIASVLAMGSKILILDEPELGQDYRSSRRIMDIMQGLHERGYTIVFVTHNMVLAAEYARRIIEIKGRKGNGN